MDNECNGKKVLYGSRKLARTALNIIARSRHKDKYPIREYRCNVCQGWHITSRTEDNDGGRERPVVLKYGKKFREIINKNK